MDLKALKDTPPWDWPTGTRKLLLEILRDDRAAEADRLLATQLAGDFTVINDDVAEALLSILRRGDLSDALRGQAAISLGPVLDHTDTAAVRQCENRLHITADARVVYCDDGFRSRRDESLEIPFV